MLSEYHLRTFENVAETAQTFAGTRAGHCYAPDDADGNAGHPEDEKRQLRGMRDFFEVAGAVGLAADCVGGSA